jgi:hypothetical protein
MIYKLFTLIGEQDRSGRELSKRRRACPLYKNINYIFIKMIFLQKIIPRVLKIVLSYL